MKQFLTLVAFAALSVFSINASAQGKDKSKRPSPPDSAMVTIAGGKTITIQYSSPSVKGRTVGKDLEPMPGKVWRAGANEATTFEVNKDVKVEGKALPAGKYALFMIDNGSEWTIIFNKVADTWGAYDYEKKNKAQDALQVTVKAGTASPMAERLKYTISKKGEVTLMWAEKKVSFMVK